jgi:hypothetical protein
MKTPAASNPRPRPEMIEGDEALHRFESAMKAVLKVPKSAVPSPFGKSNQTAKKPVARKG